MPLDNIFLVAVTASCCLVTALVGSDSHAQTMAALPGFVQPRGSTVTKSDTAILDRVISLDADQRPLASVLDDVCEAARATLVVHIRDSTVLARRVTLHLARVSVRTAFARALSGSGLHVTSVSNGHSLVVSPDEPTQEALMPQGGASVTGTISDSATQIPLPSAEVRVSGVETRAITGANGVYSLKGLSAGTHTLVARRLGYAPVTKVVLLEDGKVRTVDFALPASSVLLDQVVTTVTGEQQVQALGNSITILRADSVLQSAPVNSLSQVLNTRVAGLVVYDNSGLTGAAPPINIRGQNSPTLSNEPLLYVDGIRVDNSTAGSYLGGNGQSSGRFDDIAPEDIESIEVVRGPSASTLYGTDAANGVILVRTKRPEAGPVRWTFDVKQGAITLDRDRFPEVYHGWGTASTGGPVECHLLDVASGNCRIDSVSDFSPLRDSYTTPIGTGNLGEYTLQASGGSKTRFFVSGSYYNETGVLKLPDADKAALLATNPGQTFSSAALHPNALAKASGRATMATALGTTADLTVSASILSDDSRIPASTAINAGFFGPGYRDSTDGWEFGTRPAGFFLPRHDEDLDHFTSSVGGSWRPSTWLTFRSTEGLDFASDYTDALTPLGEGPPGDPGERTNARASTAIYSADVSGTASARPFGWLELRSSVGAQYTRRSQLITEAQSQNLLPGCSTVACGAQSAQESTNESVVAGIFGEETFTLGDRVFLTGAIRTDGASSFGSKFNTALYPKLSASWNMLRDPLLPKVLDISSLRLRAAYGESGIQPGPTDALALEQLSPTYNNGSNATGAHLTSLGDPNLKPERTHEVELGFDSDLLSNRLHLSGTYYRKQSTDALEQVALPVSLIGSFGSTQIENVGSVLNWGYEFTASTRLIDTKPVAIDIAVNGSTNTNRLISLGNGVSSAIQDYGNGSLRPGYPLFALFTHPFQYKDLNGDGIIEPNELNVDSSYSFVGQVYPKTQLSTTFALSFFSSAIRVAAQLDYRGGFKLINFTRVYQCLDGNCLAVLDKRTPLSQQAAMQDALVSGLANETGLYEDASFTRLREVSVTWRLPRSVVGFAKARGAAITFAARNLALWTKYSGTDPEVLTYIGLQSSPFYDAGSLPPSRYFTGRLSLEY